MADPVSMSQAPTIADPDRIQPGPLQGDTNRGVTFSPINNNAERLAQSLEQFSHGINHLSRVEGMLASRDAQDKLVRDRQAEAQAKQDEMNRQQQALSSYQSSTTAQQQRDDYINGRVPAFANGTYTHALYMHSAANMAADELSETMTQREQSGQIPYGTDGFNAQQDLITQAAAIKQKYGVDNDPVMSKQFAERLHPMRAAVDERQAKALGEAVMHKNATINYSEAAAAFDSSHMNGETPEQTSDRMRAVFQAHDPAFGGTGPYSLTGTHNDKIMMQILADKAQDPETAQRALAIMQAPRHDADNNSVPSLAANPQNREAYNRIAATVAKTMDGAEVASTTDAVRKADIAAALRGDKSLAVQVQTRPADTSYGTAIPKMDAATRTKVAIDGAIQQIRAANGGQPDLQKEIQLCARNDVPHPQVFQTIQRAAGMVGSTSASPADQQQALAQASQLYHYAGDQNPAWAAKNIDPHTKEMIDQFDLLSGVGGLTSEAATAKVAELAREPEKHVITFTHDQATTITQNAKNITTVNAGEMEKHISSLATAYAKTGMDRDMAISAATERVTKQYPTLNGTAVSSSLVSPEDYPHVQAILKNTFEASKADFAADHITSPDQLSIHPTGNGQFIVTKSDGGTLSNNHFISPSMIAAQRARTEKQVAEKAKADAGAGFDRERAVQARRAADQAGVNQRFESGSVAGPGIL